MVDEVAIGRRFEIEVRDLEYQRADGVPLLARLYRPTGSGPFPAVIDVHGGAWASGDRLNNAPLDEALARAASSCWRSTSACRRSTATRPRSPTSTTRPAGSRRMPASSAAGATWSAGSARRAGRINCC